MITLKLNLNQQIPTTISESKDIINNELISEMIDRHSMKNIPRFNQPELYNSNNEILFKMRLSF